MSIYINHPFTSKLRSASHPCILPHCNTVYYRPLLTDSCSINTDHYPAPSPYHFSKEHAAITFSVMSSSTRSSSDSRKKTSNDRTFAMTRSKNRNASASSSRTPHRVSSGVVIAAGASSSSGSGTFGLIGNPGSSGWTTSKAKKGSPKTGRMPSPGASSSDRGYVGSTHSYPSPGDLRPTGSDVVPNSSRGTPYRPNPPPPAPGPNYGCRDTNQPWGVSNIYPSNTEYGDSPQFPQHQSQQQNMFGSAPALPFYPPPSAMAQSGVPPPQFPPPSAIPPTIPTSDYQPKNTAYTGAEGGPPRWTPRTVTYATWAEPSVSKWEVSVSKWEKPADFICDISDEEDNSPAITRRERDF